MRLCDQSAHPANSLNCAPLLILSPVLKRRGALVGKGYVANPPICWPPLIMSPDVSQALKRPRVGVMYAIHPFVGPSHFIPLSEVLRIPSW